MPTRIMNASGAFSDYGAATNAVRYMGEWSAATTYAVNDLVQRSGAFYLATGAPGAAGVKDPAAAVGTTEVIATLPSDFAAPGPYAVIAQAFTPTSDYTIGAVKAKAGHATATIVCELAVDPTPSTASTDTLTPLASSAALVKPPVTVGGALNTWPLTVPLAVSSGTAYRLTLRTAGGAVSPVVGYVASPTATGATLPSNGGFKTGSDGGSLTYDSPASLVFRLSGEAGTNPWTVM